MNLLDRGGRERAARYSFNRGIKRRARIEGSLRKGLSLSLKSIGLNG